MTRRRSRFRFYIILYSLTGIVAVIGLTIGIQTIPVNENSQKLSIRLKTLQDENQRLKLTVLTKTRLEIVDQIAATQLAMFPPPSITFIQEKDKPNVFNYTAP